jgi:hypothetical protein
MVTTKGTIEAFVTVVVTPLTVVVVVPVAYRVEVPPALLETQKGLVGLETNPQAF